MFDNSLHVECALDTLKKVQAIHPFTMKGWVIMPDHLHLMIHTDDGRFDRVIHSFKRNVSLEFHKKGFCSGDIWQKRFYDHVIRDDENFRNHLDYIHFNPVHHNQVERPADYVFSSFYHYAERGRYTPDWGNMALDHIKDMNLE